MPIDKIVSRHERSMANLPLALRLVDRGYVYDNSVDGSAAKLFARTVDGSVRKVYGQPPEWVQVALARLPHHPEFAEADA